MELPRVLVVFSAMLSMTGAQCPNSWVPYKNSCYLFGTELEEYVVAEQFCRQHDSHLLHVEDSPENEFIKSWLRRLHTNDWWMGLSDLMIETVWEWEDTHKQATFTDWHPGQPDDNAHEDCADFTSAFNFQWNDHDCTGKRMAICEKSRYGSGLEMIG